MAFSAARARLTTMTTTCVKYFQLRGAAYSRGKTIRTARRSSFGFVFARMRRKDDSKLVSARGKSHPKPTDFPLASMPPDVLQTPEGAGAALAGTVMSASLARKRSVEYTDQRRFDL